MARAFKADEVFGREGFAQIAKCDERGKDS